MKVRKLTLLFERLAEQEREADQYQDTVLCLEVTFETLGWQQLAEAARTTPSPLEVVAR